MFEGMDYFIKLLSPVTDIDKMVTYIILPEVSLVKEAILKLKI